MQQQAGQLAAARVEAEAERRRCCDLEQELAGMQGEREAAQADAAALLAQLRTAEASAVAVEGEWVDSVLVGRHPCRSLYCQVDPSSTYLPALHAGEAACAHGQLAVAEEQLARAMREVDRLKEEAASTAARWVGAAQGRWQI